MATTFRKFLPVLKVTLRLKIIARSSDLPCRIFVRSHRNDEIYFFAFRKKKNLARSLELISVGPYSRRKYGNCCYEFFHMATLSASSLPLISFYILEYIFSTVTLSNNQNVVKLSPSPFEHSLFVLVLFELNNSIVFRLYTLQKRRSLFFSCTASSFLQ